MSISSARRVSLFCVLTGTMCMGGTVTAEEAGASSAEATAPEAQNAETPPPEQSAPESALIEPAPSAAGPAGHAPTADEAAIRFGRVETVLIENDDPESALEFGAELMGQHDSARLRFLLAASLLSLNRPTEALEHLNQATRMSENDPGIHLRVLYNIARAYQSAGQLGEAADAYDRYVAFARSHGDLPSFVVEAERLARVLRSRSNARQ